MVMMQGERNPPARRPSREGSAACEAARARVRSFLLGDQALPHDRVLRAHLERCETCNQYYRESLLEVARLSRERRLLEERRDQEFDRVLHELDGDELDRSRKLRRVRAMLLPFAVVIILIGAFTSSHPTSTLKVGLLAGRATVGPRELDSHAPTREAARGEWLITDADAQVELKSAEATLELGPSSRLLVEDAHQTRVRLEAGMLGVDGPCTVCGAFGVVEVRKGRATFALHDDRLTVENQNAELRAVDAQGTRTLSVGTRSELALARR